MYEREGRPVEAALLFLVGIVAGVSICWLFMRGGDKDRPVAVERSAAEVASTAPSGMEDHREHMLSYREARFSPRGKTETRNRSGFLVRMIDWFDQYYADSDQAGWARPYGYGKVDISGRQMRWFCFARDNGDFMIFLSESITQSEVERLVSEGNGVVASIDGILDGFYTEYDIPEKFLIITGRDAVEYNGVTREVIRVSAVDAKGIMDDIVKKIFNKTGLKFQVMEYLE